MEAFRNQFLGASVIAAAGGVWSLLTLADQDWVELPKCIAFAVGFALLALSVREGNASRRAGLLVGFALAELLPLTWFTGAITSGQLPLRWGAVALGGFLAGLLMATSTLRAWDARPFPRPFLRVAFGLLGFGSLMLIVAAPQLSPWTATYVAALVGAGLLALDPPHLARRVASTSRAGAEQAAD